MSMRKARADLPMALRNSRWPQGNSTSSSWIRARDGNISSCEYRKCSVLSFTGYWGTIPLGSLTGGVLGGTTGVILTIVLGALIGTLAVLRILLSPVMGLKSIPEQAHTS